MASFGIIRPEIGITEPQKWNCPEESHSKGLRAYAESGADFISAGALTHIGPHKHQMELAQEPASCKLSCWAKPVAARLHSAKHH